MSYKFHKSGVDPYNPKKNDSMVMGQVSQSGVKFVGKVDSPEMENCSDMKFVDTSTIDRASDNTVLTT